MSLETPWKTRRVAALLLGGALACGDAGADATTDGASAGPGSAATGDLSTGGASTTSGEATSSTGGASASGTEASTGGSTTSTTGSAGETTEATDVETTGETTEAATTGGPYDFDDVAPLEDSPLDPGWSCAAFISGDDVWLRTAQDGQERFDARVGAGGAIAELRDIAGGYAPLLSPSFNDEATDRVIQWTWWAPSVTHPVDGLPEFEWRFNVTQGGTFDDLLAPIHWVTLDAAGCRVEVYASPRDQWKTEQQPHMQGTFAARTLYQVIGPGLIAIRRTLLVPPATLEGAPAPFAAVYLEGWTPMRRPTFDALALGLAPDGAPTWWYKAGQNLPTYPQIDVSTTSGFALVFNSVAPSDPVVGVLFGTRAPCRYVAGECVETGGHVLNSMEWNNGIGVLPGLHLTDVETGVVVETYMVLAPSRALMSGLPDQLYALAPTIPAPRLLEPGAALSPALAELVETLAELPAQQGTRTEHLGPLVSP